MGDTIFVNPIVLGYAWQKGWLPLGLEALMRAMELNGVAVAQNKTAFAWGRRAALDWAGVEKLLTPAQVIQITKREGLEGVIATRAEFLVAYQNQAYAETYTAFVNTVRAKEETVLVGAANKSLRLTEAVAKGLFKLMAYKDEYEVARLHTDASFHAKIASMFEGDYKLNYHLAPPLLAKTNAKGELQKQKFGPAMLTGFKLLAKLKGLRGGAFDIFGRSEERQTERALIGEYQSSIREVLQALSEVNHAAAIDVARIPEQIKGYGHVKARHLTTARMNWDVAMAAYRNPPSVKMAA
jgi:indolepyruvate ferredoxin oxidoreductase